MYCLQEKMRHEIANLYFGNINETILKIFFCIRKLYQQNISRMIINNFCEI